MIPYLLSRAAGETKRGVALPGEGPAHLHQRRATQVDGVQEAGRAERVGSRLLSRVVQPESVDDIGDYKSPRSPDEPTLCVSARRRAAPACRRGSSTKSDALRFTVDDIRDFERNMRDQLLRALGGGGFDPAREIAAITVNRWPHGYGYEYNPLFDPDWPEEERPNVIGRRRFGRITIANSDSAATAYTDAAIDQAYRAVGELLA